MRCQPGAAAASSRGFRLLDDLALTLIVIEASREAAPLAYAAG